MRSEFFSESDLAELATVSSRWHAQSWPSPATHCGPRKEKPAAAPMPECQPIRMPATVRIPEPMLEIRYEPVPLPTRDVSICQDVDVLERMGHDALVADIDNPFFIRYWSGRTGNTLGIDLDGNCGTYEQPGDRYQLPGPNARRLLANPPDSSWWITRGSLNDCWRLFNEAA